MLNFTYQNTTKIIFGDAQIGNLTTEIPSDANVLVLFGGGSIKQNGIYDQVSAALLGYNWFEFSGIEPNPSYETLMKSLDIIKEKEINYLLAVGGGSVIDGSKFIAAAARYEGVDPWDILSKKSIIEEALPLGVILTLPATGSESNASAVITRNKNKRAFYSPKVRPQFAILDPSVTLSLSNRHISNGVVDAFIHVIEQYLTFSVNAKVQDRIAEGLLLTLIEEGPRILSAETEQELDSRANIMWSATLALNGLVGAGVPQDWSTHMLGHELTGAFGIEHARSLSVILPSNMKIRREQKRDKLIQYGRRVWGLTAENDDLLIDQAIKKTEQFFQKMNLPIRLSEINITLADIETLLLNLKENGMTSLGENNDVSLDVSREILVNAL